jgi:NAD(P)-dependent dehydrogenase (short-subunit alcohol dehydrogenase family)
MGLRALAPAGRVVMISGASRGIGQAIAARLAADGFRLSLGVRNPAAVAAPAGALVQRYDALDPAAARVWADATLAHFGAIDALVNNAGMLAPFDLATGEEAVLDAHWAVNLKAPLRLIQAILPQLAASGHGRVVTIASTDGKRVREGTSVAYALSKHGAVALTHATRLWGWEQGIRATAICPGAVDTALIDGLPGVTPKPERIMPDTIADAVAYCLSLPNTASVAELVLNSRKESWI